MQAEPYLIVNGTVVGSRRVDVPAREASTGTKADGSSYTTRATDAWTYYEVAVNADAILSGSAAPDLRSILTVRVRPEDDGSAPALPRAGETVSYGVTAQVAKAYIRGRFIEWVTYTRVLDLSVGASRPTLVGSPT